MIQRAGSPRGTAKRESSAERNLRCKTDSSQDGPHKGAPAILGAGMMGDRASVLFANPEELSGFIGHAC